MKRLCLALVLTAPALGSERIKVSTENTADIEVKNLIQNVARAMDEEDLESLVLCFAGPQQARKRREMGLLFARHQVGMELLDSHLLKKDEGKCDVAARFRILIDDNPTEFVSILSLKKSEGGWLIFKEKALPDDRMKPDPMCANGKCGTGPAIPVSELHKDEKPDFGGEACANGKCGTGPTIPVSELHKDEKP